MDDFPVEELQPRLLKPEKKKMKMKQSGLVDVSQTFPTALLFL